MREIEKLQAAIGNLKTFRLLMQTATPEQMKQINKILTGEDMKKASVVAHARMREQLFTDAIERLEAFQKDTLPDQSDSERPG